MIGWLAQENICVHLSTAFRLLLAAMAAIMTVRIRLCTSSRHIIIEESDVFDPSLSNPALHAEITVVLSHMVPSSPVTKQLEHNPRLLNPT